MKTFFNLDNYNLPVTIEHIGVDWPQDVIIRHQGFPHFHWIQTEQGEGNFWVGDEHFVLAKDAGILVAPGVPHRYEPVNKQPWRVRFVTFQGTLVDEFNRQLLANKYVYLPSQQGATLHESTELLLRLLNEQPRNQAQLSAVAYYFLLHISQLQVPQLNSQHPDFIRYITPALAYIEAHFADSLTVNEIANRLAVTPQYLDRLFQRFLKQAPSDYIRHTRISHAKTLLISQKHLRVSAIANAVGYNDAAYFSAVFKRETGVTPLNYRRWQT